MKRAAIIGVFILAAVVGAFTSGYFIGERRTTQLVAEHELGALQHYVSLLGYIRKGDLANARSFVYVAADSPLSVFSADNGQSLTPGSQKILANWLKDLNTAWAEDRPFDGSQWSSVRSMPEWTEMRTRNDNFRERYAPKP